MVKIVLKQLRKDKRAILGGGFLLFFFFITLFAEVIAPYRYDFEDRKRVYHPPVRIHIIHEGRLHLPFVYLYTQIKKDGRIHYVPLKEHIYPLRFFVKGQPYKLFGLFWTRWRFFGVEEPARVFLLGSDWNGRCIFSRILYGARVSISCALIAVVISFFIGMLIGGISGYFGGVFDAFCMRIVEVFICMPSFYLLLALRAIFPMDISSQTSYILIVLILSFVGWASLARVIRGIVLSIREHLYIMAAKALGLGTFRILMHHVLPQTFSYAIVAATLSIPGYILSESALSLLGLGISEPYASWGNMLAKAMSVSEMMLHPWILTPGLFIFISVLAFNLLGEALRDAIDPYTMYLKRG